MLPMINLPVRSVIVDSGEFLAFLNVLFNS